jgi:muramoyltetrapeptide carboxypeptidase
MLISTSRTVPPLKKPRRLTTGASLVLISPGSPAHSPDLASRVIERFAQLGFQVSVAPNANERLGFLAGTDGQRLSDINGAFSSDIFQAIVCTRGGYGSGRIIQSVNFLELNKHPKLFVGSSDLTTIINGCILEAGVTALHGPTMESLLDPSTPSFTVNSLISHITGDQQALGSICAKCPKEHLRAEGIHKGRATGKLVGGNLAVIMSTIGTPFFPSFEDAIVFFEDVGETPFRVDRNLTQLLNLGVLEKVRGFALGTFERCAYRPEEATLKQTLRDVVIDRLAPLQKPIVLGLPFGHTAYNCTIPVGVSATLDANQADLIIEELAVA